MEENLVNEVPETTDGFMEGFDETDVVSAAADEQEIEIDGGAESADKAAEDTETDEAETTAEEETGADEAETTNEPPAEAPKSWVLKHFQGDKTVNEDELVQLAQKGVDYDRVHEKWNEAKPVMELFKSFADKAGKSVTEYVADLRAAAKQQSGMSEEEARRTIALEDREAAVAQAEAQREAERQAAASADTAAREAEERRAADIREFAAAFPDAAKDPDMIPQEVWDEVNQGKSLALAYSMYQTAQAKANAAATTQNAKNAERSTGSMRSAGNDTKSKDPFLEGFEG